MPTRSAQATWEGGLKGSGSFKGQTGLGGQFNFNSRFADGAGSNPEELLAAAEAACYSMALSLGLENNGTPATRVETTAKCTIEKVDEGFSITRMQIETRATVANLDNDAFQKIAAATKDGCPVSKALKGNVDLQLTATLAS
jgi:lipoyl-dependent peroxiredoxin